MIERFTVMSSNRCNIIKMNCLLMLFAFFAQGCNFWAVEQDVLSADKISEQERSFFITALKELGHAETPDGVMQLTLEECKKLAVRLNFQMRLSTLDHAIKHNEKQNAFLAMFPSAEADFERINRNKEDWKWSSTRGEADPPTSEREYTKDAEKKNDKMQFRFLFNFVDFGISYLAYQQSELKADIELAIIERLRQNIEMDVTRDYLELQTREKYVEIANLNLNFARQRLEFAKSAVKAGEATPLTEAQRQSDVRTAEREIVATKRETEKARLLLCRTVGVPLDLKLITATNMLTHNQLPPLDHTLEELDESAFQKRPELRVKDNELSISAAEAKKILLECLPRPEVFWDWTYDSNKYNLYNTYSESGWRVAWNMFSLPENYLRVKNEKLSKEKIVLEKKEIYLGILAQIRLSYFDCQLAFEDAKDKYDALAIEEDKLLSVKEHFSVGLTHVIEVLEQENTVLRLRKDYLSSACDYLLAFSTLENVSLIRSPMTKTVATNKNSNFKPIFQKGE